MPLSLAATELPRDIRIQLFEWIANRGPFIDEDRQALDEDLFFFQEHEVTDLGLGEAARRICAGLLAASLSPVRSPSSRFARSELGVVHGFPEEPIAQVAVANYTDCERVTEVLRTLDPDAQTWAELLTDCRRRFDLLHIGPHCDGTLGRLPFNPAAGRRIITLLDILQRIKAEMSGAGELSRKGIELRNTFFSGRTARFSDESETRKRRRRDFTFPDPAGGDDIVCFWHGKIATSGIRIHFDWPVADGQNALRVVYIGPHL